MDAYTPVRGKCTWWREIPNADDAYNLRIKELDKRVECRCFVEGHFWVYSRAEIPANCPNFKSCRYYIKYY